MHLAVAVAAAALTACVSASSWEAKRVLDDIAAASGPSALKRSTPTPRRETVDYKAELGDRRQRRVADLYHPRQRVGAALVLVPGFTRQGKDDPRVVSLADSLARARFRVLVPDLPGSRGIAFGRRDSEEIADAVLYLSRLNGRTAESPPVAVAAISYAVGPAIDAALRPSVLARLDFVVSLGGYHDAVNVVTFITTGYYRAGPMQAWRKGTPRAEAKWIFLLDNVDWLAPPEDREHLTAIARARLRGRGLGDLPQGLGPRGRALFILLENRDPDRVRDLIAALPETVQARLSALSPAKRDLTPLAGKLILIHGTRDGLVPPSESEALAAAAGGGELYIIPGFSHIDPGETGIFGRLALIDAMQAVLLRRRP